MNGAAAAAKAMKKTAHSSIRREGPYRVQAMAGWLWGLLIALALLPHGVEAQSASAFDEVGRFDVQNFAPNDYGGQLGTKPRSLVCPWRRDPVSASIRRNRPVPWPARNVTRPATVVA